MPQGDTGPTGHADHTGRGDHANRTEADWVRVLRRRESLCRRAPSAHNTQPWTLRYEPEAITIGWLAERELPAGDPTRRDLYLSLGAFLETCLIVAADAGLAVRAEVDVDERRRTVARLLPAYAPDDEPFSSPFATRTVLERRCARGPYHPGRLAAPQLARVRGTINDRPHHQLVELPARELAGLTVRADRRMYGHRAVVAELRHWLRTHRGHPRYAADGLSYEALALTRSEAAALRLALAPGVYPLLRQLGLSRLLAASQRGLLRCEGSVLLLTEPAEQAGGRGAPRDAAASVTAGRQLVRTWYALTEEGLSVHPLSQLLDDPNSAARLNALLPEGAGRVLAVFRAGRPLHTPPESARLPVEEARGQPATAD